MVKEPSITWRKSSYSTAGGECVEIATLADGRIALRDSKNPGGGMLRFSPGAMAVWLVGVKSGVFVSGPDAQV